MTQEQEGTDQSGRVTWSDLKLWKAEAVFLAPSTLMGVIQQPN